MSDDGPTLIQFKAGWERDGTGKDGLPIYKANIIIRKDRPPYLSLERVATQDDIEENPQPFQLFRKEQAARKQSYSEGYPVALWPAVGEAEFRMLVDRDITTVEQLSKLRERDAPSEIKELAQRARKLMELQAGAAKYEELLKDRDDRIAVLEEQVRDASLVIAQQKTEIDTLRFRSSGSGYIGNMGLG